MIDQSSSRNPTLRGKRVLICEDEALIQMHWSKLLSHHGASVVNFTPSGEECVDMVLKHRPDIVLMDAALLGMDGWEASRRILKSWDTCIIMVTAEAADSVNAKIKDVAISGYIPKPALGVDFIQAVAKCYMDSAGNGRSDD